MSTILPNGTIRFLTNVPIDEDYQNSIDFLDETAQKEYFLGLVPVYIMQGATRVRDGVISVSASSDSLLPCNYLMFQNLDFYAKWFYAFITNVEYVNNNMCNVYYMIDDVQTWMFDTELEECFVEREHTTTDRMFEHLVDESVKTSEYVDCGYFSKIYDRYKAMLFTQTYFTPSGGGEDEIHVAPSVIRAGTLDSAILMTFDLQDNNGAWLEPQYPPESDDAWTGNGLDLLGATIYKITDKQQADSIVSLNVFPEAFAGDIGTNAKTDNLRFDNFTSSTQLNNGYVPTNKKLYNSPFCILEFGTTDGQKITLQPEFVNDNCEINIIANISPSPSLIAFPFQYEGKQTDYEHALSIENFPQASLAIDGYKAWIASGGLSKQYLSIASSVTGGVLNTMGTLASGNLIGGVASVTNAVTSIANSIIDMNVAKTLPAIKVGSTNSQPLTSDKRVGYFIRRMCLTKDIMKSIDDYFTMYGYRVNKVKKPSRRNRPHYTYVKTKGCKIRGGAPADAISRLQTIYDKGIRFWVDADEVGKYSEVDNSPS